MGYSTRANGMLMLIGIARVVRQRIASWVYRAVSQLLVHKSEESTSTGNRAKMLRPLARSCTRQCTAW